MFGSHRKDDKDEDEVEIVLANESESLCIDLKELGPARFGLCDTGLSSTIRLFAWGESRWGFI